MVLKCGKRFEASTFPPTSKNIGYGGLGAGPALVEGGHVVTVYAPANAHTVAEYCRENDIIFVAL